VLLFPTQSQLLVFTFLAGPVSIKNLTPESLQDPIAEGALVGETFVGTILGDSVGTLVHAPHVFGQ
jgi:hypothetical protein